MKWWKRSTEIKNEKFVPVFKSELDNNFNQSPVLKY